MTMCLLISNVWMVLLIAAMVDGQGTSSTAESRLQSATNPLEKEEQRFPQLQDAMLDSDLKPILDGSRELKKHDKNAIRNFATIQTPTCMQELDMRKHFSRPDDPLKHGSELLRLVFHDALDFNNLHDESGEALESSLEPYGGVDGCLFSGASLGDDGEWHPDPGHNNGLRHSIRVSTKAQKRFTEISKADLKVVGALAALEEDARGPHVPMKWGREVPLDCQLRAGKYEKNTATNVNSTQWIHIVPDSLSFSHQKLLDVFTKLGFTQTDMVALMGAHSYGDVSQCSKTLNKVEVGNYCEKDRPKHWETVGGHKTERPVGALDKHGKNITKSGTYGKWRRISDKFDDGAVWDQTPACFDNRYYKTFASAKFEWKDGCCGTSTVRSSQRGGSSSTDMYCKAGRGVGDDNKATQYINGSLRNNGDICDETHPWCRSDWPYDGEEKHDKTTMRNVYDFAFEDYQMPAGADGTWGMSAGWMKPVFRMPPEWALLEDTTSKGLLAKYADSERDFFNDFANAFTKVLEMTPQKDVLEQCQAVDCTFNRISQEFECDDRRFAADNVDCPAPTNSSCKIVQAIGVRALIKCQEELRLCCEGVPCTKTLRAWQHKVGASLGTCFDDPTVREPNVGDTAARRGYQGRRLQAPTFSNPGAEPATAATQNIVMV
jgi:hypothetical protein